MSKWCPEFSSSEKLLSEFIRSAHDEPGPYLNIRLAHSQIKEHGLLGPDESATLDRAWERYKPWLKLSVPERFAAIGVSLPTPWYPPEVEAFTDVLRRASLSNQAQAARSRMHHEIVSNPRLPWFHITLTVNALHYQQVFSTGSKCFRDFVTELRRTVASAIYGPSVPRRQVLQRARADGLWLVKYSAVLEKGERGGRRHLHSLMAFQKLPRQWRDPNAGFASATNDEVKPISAYWRYGFSRPKPLRMGAHDYFSRKGWRWPNDRKTGLPSPGYEPGAIAGYLSKYLTKATQSASDALYRFRTRFSRGFGLSVLDSWLSQLSHGQIQSLLEVCHSSSAYAALKCCYSDRTSLPLPPRAFTASYLVSRSMRFISDLPISELAQCLETHYRSSPYRSCLRTLRQRCKSAAFSSALPKTLPLPGRSPTPLTRSSSTAPLPPVSRPWRLPSSIPLTMSTSLARIINVPMMSHSPCETSHVTISLGEGLARLHQAVRAMVTNSFRHGSRSSLFNCLVSHAPVVPRHPAPPRPPATPSIPFGPL